MAYKKPLNPDDQPEVATGGTNDPNAPPPEADPANPPGTSTPTSPKPTGPPAEWSAKFPGQPTTGYDWVWNTSPTYTYGQAPQYTTPSWQWQRICDTATQGAPSTPTPTTNPNDPRSMIDQALQTAYGRAATQQDYDYWLGKWSEWGSRDPNYFQQRLLGMGAGGNDIALYGPYSLAAGYRPPTPEAPRTAYDTGPSLGSTLTQQAMTPWTGAAGEDPFASMGGGVFIDGGWKPRAMLTPEQLAAYDASRA